MANTEGRWAAPTDPLPPLETMRYGSRPIRFVDTGERAEIVTIDGEPVALEPSRAALDDYAARYHMELVSREHMRHLHAELRAARRLPRWLRKRLSR